MDLADLRRLYELLKQFQPGSGSPPLREVQGMVARAIVDQSEDEQDPV
jgi:hypothetical protein